MARGWRERRARGTSTSESVDERANREMDEIAGEAGSGARHRPANARRPERPRMLSRLRAAPNVGRRERVGSALLGSGLVAAGLRRRGPLGAALALGGGALMLRGASGRCAAYAALGRDTATPSSRPQKQHGPNAVLDASDAIRVEHEVTIDRPVEDLWQYWRRLDHLSLIMRHIESVKDEGGGISSWVARGPAGTRVRWRARIINEIPNELLAWKSLDDADVPNAGSVHFTPGHDGTTVRVLLEYAPPAGRIGAMVASLFGGDPDAQIHEDLVRFRDAMEAQLAPRLQGSEHQVNVTRANESTGRQDSAAERGAPGVGRDRTMPPAPELDDDQAGEAPA